MKLLLVSLFCVILPLLCCAEDICMLQTTDIHGCLAGDSAKPGLERIASKILALRKQYGDALILFDCGDLTQGSFSATMNQGKSMIDALNYLKYDFLVPGNHDFDYGVPALLEHMKQFHGPVLAANITFDNPPANLKKWMLLTKGKRRIAVIGIVPPFLSQWIAPAQLKGIAEIPLEKALRDALAEIDAVKPDLVVLAIHLGEFISPRLTADAKRHSLGSILAPYPAIRLVFGGHTHISVPMKRINAAAFYTQAPAISAGLAEVRISFPDDPLREIHFEGKLHDCANEPPDPGTSAVLDGVRADAAAKRRNPVASVPFALEPMPGPKKRCVLAELLCKAMRDGTGADAAFSSSLSSARTNPGKLTEYQIFLLAPYENFITVLTLTPSHVREILAEQLALKQKNAFLHVEGITYKKNKDRIELFHKGKPWTDEAKPLRFAVGSYAVSGAGGRYKTLKAIAEKVPRSETAFLVRDLFRDWLKRHYPVSAEDRKGQK